MPGVNPAASGPVETVIDRLMNPDVLANLGDGIASAAVVKKVAAKEAKECVLADLQGPGAVVRIARTNSDGRLAFYFDGEERPRIQCKPGDLWKALPELTETNNPVLTCLTFRRAAQDRAPRRQAGRVPPRLSAVPGRLPARVVRQGRRGCAAAVDRGRRVPLQPGGLGHAPRARPAAAVRIAQEKLAPGKTESLLRLDGAGVVRWLKLRANKKVLENNDLWLEVTVDGEPSPALASPARFLFAGLAGQGNFANFVMTDRGGPTFLLPMPYRDGMTIAARNAGQQPIAEVGVQVSFDKGPVPIFAQGTFADTTSPARLRGVFQAAQSGDDLLRRDGRGRWIGLVCQLPAKERTKVLSLTVDGKPADGWAAESFDGLLGQSGDFRTPSSGRRGDLCWRYFQLDAVDFRQSLVLKTGRTGDCLGLFYAEQ